jgi:hypothetical protein
MGWDGMGEEGPLVLPGCRAQPNRDAARHAGLMLHTHPNHHGRPARPDPCPATTGMTKLSSTLAAESKSYSARAKDLHRQVGLRQAAAYPSASGGRRLQGQWGAGERRAAQAQPRGPQQRSRIATLLPTVRPRCCPQVCRPVSWDRLKRAAALPCPARPRQALFRKYLPFAVVGGVVLLVLLFRRWLF